MTSPRKRAIEPSFSAAGFMKHINQVISIPAVTHFRGLGIPCLTLSWGSCPRLYAVACFAGWSRFDSAHFRNRTLASVCGVHSTSEVAPSLSEEEPPHSSAHQKYDYRQRNRYPDHCSRFRSQKYVKDIAKQIDRQ